MASRGLRSLIPGRHTNPTELLKELQLQIDELRTIATETDFSDSNDIRIFSENISYIRRYFEAYNRLIEYEQYK